MEPSDAPKFLDGTFIWTQGGYQFASPPPRALANVVPHTEPDRWLALAAILEAAKAGRHEPVAELTTWALKAHDIGLQQSALALLGDAGIDVQVTTLTDVMQHADNDYLKVKACEAAANAGYLWLARDALRVWESVRRTERDSVSLYLSLMLEEPGAFQVADPLLFEDEQSYLSFVAERITTLEKQYGLGGTVFQGRPLDIGEIAEQMLGIVRSKGRYGELESIYVLRHRFEASTGIDCRAFYKDDEVQRLATADILERFLESGAAARFVPGTRYFFGHEVPTK